MTDLILALDVLEREKAVAVAEAAGPYLDAIKIGYPLVLAEGLSIAEDLAATGLPLIADFKVADIPNTNRLIAEQVFAAGCAGIIVQGFCGRDSLQAVVDVAHEEDGACYVVCEMSHPGALDFFCGGVPEELAAMTVACGADGIIAPATRPERVKELRAIIGSKKILSPGVGTQGGKPEEIAPLIDGMIVGRSIYTAEDPGAAAQSYALFCR